MVTAAPTPSRAEKKSKPRQEERRTRAAQHPEGAEELVPRIKEEHRAVVAAMEAGLEHAIRTGEYLAAAKQFVSHGAWRKWVEEKCEFSYRTARNYLRVYRQRDQLPKREEISYRKALLRLRADPAKKARPKPRKVFRTVGMTDLKRLLQKHKVGAVLERLLPVLQDLGIKVK